MIIHKKLKDYAQIVDPTFMVPNPNPSINAVYILGRGVSQVEYDQIKADLTGCIGCITTPVITEADNNLLADIANIT